jgi:hypothetical protein
MGVPVQTGVAAAALVNLGVTVTVAVIGDVPVFVAVKVGRLPTPDVEESPTAAPVTVHS